MLEVLFSEQEARSGYDNPDVPWEQWQVTVALGRLQRSCWLLADAFRQDEEDEEEEPAAESKGGGRGVHFMPGPAPAATLMKYATNGAGQTMRTQDTALDMAAGASVSLHRMPSRLRRGEAAFQA